MRPTPRLWSHPAAVGFSLAVWVVVLTLTPTPLHRWCVKEPLGDALHPTPNVNARDRPEWGTGAPSPTPPPQRQPKPVHFVPGRVA